MVAPFIFIKLGMAIGNKTKEEPVAIFNVPKPKKKPQITPEQDRIMQIMSNIDSYNGSAVGQKKVEVKHV